MYGAKQDPGNGSGGRTYDMCGAYYNWDEIIPQQAEHLRLSIAILPPIGAIEDILPIGAIGAILAIRALGAIEAIEQHMAIGPHGTTGKTEIKCEQKNL